ncbi:hypothetical protein Tco_0568956 [Tanacetum coccineum]
MSNKFREGVKHSDLKQALRGRHPMLIVDCPDCEDSRALSFIFHSQEFHILSFILGIQKRIFNQKEQKESQKANKSKHGMERTKSKVIEMKQIQL